MDEILFLQKNFTQNVIIIVATKNKEGTVGTSFHGVKNNILSPDSESGEGEIIVSSRAVFMGYVKVWKIRPPESSGGLFILK